MTEAQKKTIMANIQANPDASIIVMSNGGKGTILIDGKDAAICILLQTLIHRLPAAFTSFLVEQIKTKVITEAIDNGG